MAVHSVQALNWLSIFTQLDFKHMLEKTTAVCQLVRLHSCTKHNWTAMTQEISVE